MLRTAVVAGAALAGVLPATGPALAGDKKFMSTDRDIVFRQWGSAAEFVTGTGRRDPDGAGSPGGVGDVADRCERY